MIPVLDYLFLRCWALKTGYIYCLDSSEPDCWYQRKVGAGKSRSLEKVEKTSMEIFRINDHNKNDSPFSNWWAASWWKVWRTRHRRSEKSVLILWGAYTPFRAHNKAFCRDSLGHSYSIHWRMVENPDLHATVWWQLGNISTSRWMISPVSSSKMWIAYQSRQLH